MCVLRAQKLTFIYLLISYQKLLGTWHTEWRTGATTLSSPQTCLFLCSTIPRPVWATQALISLSLELYLQWPCSSVVTYRMGKPAALMWMVSTRPQASSWLTTYKGGRQSSTCRPEMPFTLLRPGLRAAASSPILADRESPWESEKSSDLE